MEQKKKVNVYASRPIYELNPPIRTKVRNTMLSIKDIRTCIMAKAKVEEVFRDGSTIILNLGNYNKENQPPAKKDEDKTESAHEIVEDSKVSTEETETSNNVVYEKETTSEETHELETNTVNEEVSVPYIEPTAEVASTEPAEEVYKSDNYYTNKNKKHKSKSQPSKVVTAAELGSMFKEEESNVSIEDAIDVKDSAVIENDIMKNSEWNENINEGDTTYE